MPEQKPEPKTTDIQIWTIVSNRTRQGMVCMKLNTEECQMTLDKAREVLAMLSGAIEAAVSDQLLFQFLTEKCGIDEQGAGRALLDFREMRQGSRETVYPN